jgi:N6-adenosine-specific RNA methylase IME4
MTTELRTHGAFLSEAAAEIRRLGKAAVADLVEIGRLLTECKERLSHGAWLPWLDREFKWSDQTARNFMHLYAMAAESKTVLNLDLPLRDLYRLAAPSTPEDARTEVIDRVAGGERLDHDEIKSIIERHGESAVMRAAKQLRTERTEVRRAERFEHIAEIAKGNTALLTTVRYPILLADVAWRFKSFAGDESPSFATDYPTMEIEEICALPVEEIATDPAILFFWSTSPFLKLAFTIISAWGFKYSTSMVWDKTGGVPGMGHTARIDHEIVLIARRGDFPPPPPSARPSSVIRAPKREHSRKPDKLYEMIEAMYPDLPKFELFARGPARPGWAFFGNEARPALPCDLSIPRFLRREPDDAA